MGASNTTIPSFPPSVPDLCDGQTGMAFFGATTNVTLAPGQIVQAAAAADLAAGPLAGPSGVKDLSLNICWKGSATQTFSDGDFLGDPSSGGTGGLALPAGAKMPFTLSRAFTTLPPDNYDIGLCGCINATGETAAWVSDYSWITVQVVQQ